MDIFTVCKEACIRTDNMVLDTLKENREGYSYCFIKDVFGTVVSISIQENTTAGHIKTAILLSSDSSRLIFAGKSIDDETKISSLGSGPYTFHLLSRFGCPEIRFTNISKD